MDKARMKKIGNVVINVLLCIFLVICILTVFITLSSKKSNDGAAEIFGHQMRIVTTDSMAECKYTDVSDFKIKDIPARSMVFVRTVPEDPAEAEEWYSSLKVGDVLTFRYVYTTQVTITHRIISISEKQTGGFVIELSGDNKTSEDGSLVQTIDTSVPNSTNYVIGKVVGQSYPLGFVMSILTQRVGIILLIIVPCFIIILLEALKIVNVLGAEKKKKAQEEKEKQENEIEELRRRVAELENEKKDASADGVDNIENTENSENSEVETE